MITIYHNPRCRKSREALAILNDSGIQPVIRLYLKEPPTRKELSDLLKKLQLRPLELVRKGESLYKEHFKGKELSDQEWVAVMVDNPVLIERPVVVKGNRAVIGRPPSNVTDLLSS